VKAWLKIINDLAKLSELMLNFDDLLVYAGAIVETGALRDDSDPDSLPDALVKQISAIIDLGWDIYMQFLIAEMLYNNSYSIIANTNDISANWNTIMKSLFKDEA